MPWRSLRAWRTPAPSAKETETPPPSPSSRTPSQPRSARWRASKDVDELENLAGIYGHYVDKSRHDDVADLFAPEGVVEILGRGVFIGQDRVREYMRNLTPGNVGPREGSLFNHMHQQPVVHVSPDGDTAYVRSRLFVMFGVMNTAPNGATASTRTCS